MPGTTENTPTEAPEPVREPTVQPRRHREELERRYQRAVQAMRLGRERSPQALLAILAELEEMYQALSWDPDPWSKVELARDTGRPQALDAVRLLLADPQPLGGARGQGEDPAVVCRVGRLGTDTVVFVGQQRGVTAAEQLRHNYGMVSPIGFRVFQRAARWAEQHGYPLLTWVDTPGAMPGIEAEQAGIAESIAQSLQVMAGLRVPTLAVVAGEGGSGGALALALCDRVLMLENAIYSVISPEACASILWRDGGRARLAASLLKLTSADMLRMNIVEEVVPEPLGGAHRQPIETLAGLRHRVLAVLAELQGQDRTEMLEARYSKYRAMGQWREDGLPAGEAA